MGQYSSKVQGAQQSAKKFYGQGTGQTGQGGNDTNYETLLTSDPYSPEQQGLQGESINSYSNLLAQPNLGFSGAGFRQAQEERQGRDLEKLRGNQFMRGIDPESGIGHAGEVEYLAQSSPIMEGQINQTRLGYENMIRQGVQSAAFGGRSRGFSAVPTAQQDARDNPYGGAQFKWMGSQGSPDIDAAYKANSGRGYQYGTQQDPNRPQPKQPQVR